MKRNRESASDQLRRILAVIPWIAERPGVELTKAATHFGISVSQLTRELGVVFMVGVPPYSPDALVDVVIDEGKVWISYADFFSRPLKLTSGQGFGLLAASQALLETPGNEHGEALSRALVKLSASLGLSEGSNLDVALGQAGRDYVTDLKRAVAEELTADIEYYSYGRDDLSTRTIEASRVFSSNGAWYCEAYCHSAGDTRLFRLDRISRLTLDVQRPESEPYSSSDEDSAIGVLCRIQLGPNDSWVIDSYECEVLTAYSEGPQIIEMRIHALPWLERLLLRMSTDAVLLDAESLNQPKSIRSLAAIRILNRYSS